MILDWKRPTNRHSAYFCEAIINEKTKIAIFEYDVTLYKVEIIYRLKVFFSFDVQVAENITIKDLFTTIENKLLSQLDDFSSVRLSIRTLIDSSIEADSINNVGISRKVHILNGLEKY